MLPTKEAAWASFKNGEADLANAYLILNNSNEGNLFGVACFHCHQAVEKYLKGYLIFNGGKARHIHDLKILLDSCVKINGELSKFDGDCRDLNPYYIETRYEPSVPEDFDRDEATEVYQKAERIIEAIKGLIV